MTEKVIVIRADETISLEDIEIKNGSMYDGLKNIVGGYIEVVHPMYLPAPFVLVCNEEGLLKGLPFNIDASALYGFQHHGNPIVGDVAIMREGFRGGEPDLVGITDEDINSIYKSLEAVVNAFKVKEGSNG